ncbi:lytic transglycosylase domain-containing protein, partial [Phyllobacterium phragmitis]|uniref:lytic transglycosylase domain-containing protein n=1 Tax=Phyllobacterium phragmitis TaxID=2670329 RepID=UPI001FE101E3
MTAARVRPAIRSKIVIPLFAEKPSHPSVPLGHRTAGARSEGQGRPSAGAYALPLTTASTLAGWRRSGDRTAWRFAVLLLAGALSVCAGSGVAVAQSAPVERPAAAHPYAAHIAEASQRFGIPEHWIRAVLRAESAGDVRAVSSAGAMGLMQVMPDTWAGLRVRHGLGRDPYGRVGMKRFTPFTGASFFIPLAKPDVRVSPHPAFYARLSSRVVL